MSKKTDYKAKNEAFLAERAQEPDIRQLPKGILYRVKQSGPPEGAHPEMRSVVSVHYTGRLVTGRIFDDTRRTGVPAAFRLSQVITGWQIALSHMRVGDRWTLYLPAAVGYGTRGAGDIPANSTLIFDVELLHLA